MEALKAAAASGANLQGLGLPDHIVNPNQPMQLPPGVRIDGLSLVPTPDLCFTGMVTADRLSNDSEYKDMLDDLRDQCNEFVADSVMDIKAPRPYDPMLSDQYIGIGNYGKIFVKYRDAAAAQVCKDKIHGRLYGGQQVQVYYISEEAFAKA
ncbi:hypothetical protein DUNSADRAFT_4093 [Dunaliella salina]|uniref:RRM domain-containing protein n=1 Tax=Dunaliella salina TaxID=3046 RepID=A0ABQ7GSW8_DUNSA|nr:hypothetical protein DUNSADRAFT_4093 [Dunaliella salina]|eukprot:KAF5837660.1 hypothetical protein DUNSADRAFT_4093 [Dunaliella salina]